MHARKGYTAPDANAKPANLPPLPDGVSTATRDALRSPASVSGLQVDLVSAAFKGTEQDGSVVLDAQLRGVGLGLDAGQQVTVSYQVIDTDGKIVTGAYKTFTLNLRDQSRKQVVSEGMRFVDRLSLKPGRYEVRFVADQPESDTLGSVVTHVEVPKFDAPLSISGVLIGSLSTWEHHTLHRDDDLRKRLSVDPTAVRRFPQGDELSVLRRALSARRRDGRPRCHRQRHRDGRQDETEGRRDAGGRQRHLAAPAFSCARLAGRRAAGRVRAERRRQQLEERRRAGAQATPIHRRGGLTVSSQFAFARANARTPSGERSSFNQMPGVKPLRSCSPAPSAIGLSSSVASSRRGPDLRRLD